LAPFSVYKELENFSEIAPYLTPAIQAGKRLALLENKPTAEGGFSRVFVDPKDSARFTKITLWGESDRLNLFGNDLILWEGMMVSRLSGVQGMPGIPTIQEAGVGENGEIWIEYYGIRDAYDLTKAAWTKKPITDRIEALRQFALVYQEMHRREIYHNDIKPENMVINDQNEIMVIDFGLASTKRERRNLGGTKGFFDPEGPRGVVTDIFSFGVTLQALLLSEAQTKIPTRPKD
jgi:serine/threonine protein kinase